MDCGFYSDMLCNLYNEVCELSVGVYVSDYYRLMRWQKMSEKELKERIHDEYTRCMNAITGIDKEMCRLQGRREELEDRRQMLWELINK